MDDDPSVAPSRGQRPPPTGECAHHPELDFWPDTWDSDDPYLRAALACCWGCPSYFDCDQWAETHIEWGIWAGRWHSDNFAWPRYDPDDTYRRLIARLHVIRGKTSVRYLARQLDVHDAVIRTMLDILEKQGLVTQVGIRDWRWNHNTDST